MTHDRRPTSSTIEGHRSRQTLAVLLAPAVVSLVLTACGSGNESADPTVAPAASASDSEAPTTAAPATSTTVAPTTVAPRPSMRGQRYCEVLVVRPTDGAVLADVYNSWPLNECPANQFEALDAAAIAAEQGAPIALLNGPRFWLMDAIEKVADKTPPKATFGGIEMYLQATVDVGPLAEAQIPYKTHAVDRSTIFTFDAGQTVYELHSPTGETFVMQTWSQTVDPTLSESDLADLGSRLTLPDGWTYGSRTLDAELRIVTTTKSALVLQDDLKNSYSLETA